MLKTSVNGVSIAYERRGKGVPLVLLHGYPLDHSIWEPVLSLLENNYDLLLPDLRGFGEFEVVPSNFSMADFASDIAGLMDQLNIKKAAVAGHSMGGYAALAFARAYPERTLGLGLVASQTLADPPETKAGRYQQAENILAHGVKEVAEAMPVKLTANLKLQTWLKDLILRQRPQGLAGALRAMAERSDSTPSLAGFGFPLVLVHGTADAMIPVERARAVKAAAANALLSEIPEAGHMAMMENPRETVDALLRLVQPAKSQSQPR